MQTYFSIVPKDKDIRVVSGIHGDYEYDVTMSYEEALEEATKYDQCKYHPDIYFKFFQRDKELYFLCEGDTIISFLK